MTSTVDNRVVHMDFDNGKFESGVQTSLKSLDSLKKGLNLDESANSLRNLENAGKSFSLSPMTNAVENISSKFSALGVVAFTVIQGLTTSVINFGKEAIKAALGLDYIKSGFAEYEQGLNSFQTIIANTKTAGATVEDVNKALAELNIYANKTIFSFGDMTKAIGLFTAQGVKLKDSNVAIKGIFNAVALTGGNAEKANSLIYQLSQAIASGTVRAQDWISVVNSGIGGTDFQNQLQQTARVHGVAVDAMIKKDGSFRESLKEGWLTSDILVETLTQYTGDLTEEQLKSLGYSKDQIKQIQALGATANESATKLKTFTQVMETWKSNLTTSWASSFKIILGGLDDASNLWTYIGSTIGDALQASSDARNKILTDWAKFGGRVAFVDAIHNTLDGLFSILKPIKEAFSEIFPPVTGQQLKLLTVGLRDLTAKLKIGGDTADKIKRIFKGVGSAFKIVFDFVGALANGLLRLAKAIFPSSGSILDFLAKIGDYITRLKTAVETSKVFGKAIDSIGVFLEKVRTAVINFYNKVTEVFGKVHSTFANVFKNVDINGFKRFIGTVGAGLGNLFKNLDFSSLKNFANSFKTGFSNFLKGIDFSGFKSFVDSFVASVKTALGNMFKNINTGGIKSFVDRVKARFQPLNGIAPNVKNSLGGIGKFLSGVITTISPAFGKVIEFLKNLISKVGTFIAQGFKNLDFSKINFNGVFDGLNAGLLAALVLAIRKFFMSGSGVFDEAKGILGGLTGVLDGVRGSLETWQSSLKAKTLLTIAAAIAILAVSLIALSLVNSEKLTSALTAVTVLFAELVGSLTLLDKVDGKSGSNSVVKIVGMSIALLILSAAVAKLSTLDPDKLIKGVLALGVVLLELGIFTKTIGDSKSVLSTALGLAVLGVALLIIVDAMRKMGEMSPDEISNGLIRMAASLAIIFLAVKLMPKDMPAIGLGLVLLSGSIVVLSEAMKIMGKLSWDTIVKGLVGLAGSMLIIAIGLRGMQNTVGGAAALLIVAAALTIFVPVLKSLGSMPIEQIAIGLGVLAALFVVLGVAGLVLGPLTPVILALTGALFLFGLACLAVGVGTMAFATGLATLAAIGTLGAAAIVLAVTTILGLIPVIAAALAKGLLTFVSTLADGTPTIVTSFTNILLSLIAVIVTVTPAVVNAIVVLVLALIAAIVTLVPAFVEAGLTILTAFLQSLAAHIPEIVQAGYDILIGIITGIANNIGEVVSKAMDVVTNFIDGIAKKIPDVIKSAMNLLLQFINGLADAIKIYTPQINDAVGNLVDAIIDGLTLGLQNGVDGVAKALSNLGLVALAALKKALGIKSPSKETALVGGYVTQGFANGILENAKSIRVAATKLGNEAVSGLGSVISTIYDTLNSDIDMNPTIRPVVDLTGVTSGGKKINDILGNKSIALSASVDKVSAITNGLRPSSQTINSDKEVAPVGDKSIVFTQYNYSPEALSTATIYRQTRNQISRMKGLLGTT